MKFNKNLIAILSVIAVAVLAYSCDDDDESSSYSYLSGTLEYTSPAYTTAGDVLTLTPTGGSHPDGGDYGYYWYTTPTSILEANDTTRYIGDDSSVDGSLVFTVPDTLCTFTLTCCMYASGYYGISATNTITIVSDKSVTGILHTRDEGTFTDERDGTEYRYTTYDGLDWMNTNLAYDGTGNPYGGRYQGSSPITPYFGNLYTYDQAEEACPDGWRIPTLEEWKAIGGGEFIGTAGNYMVDAYFNSEKMWEYWPDVNITNSSGLNVMPTGYAFVYDDWSYSGLNEFAIYWTSTDYDDEQKMYIGLYVDQPDVIQTNIHRETLGASVRCVRESSE